ncbi:MAG: secretion protein HlyD, partial [Bauldia sp.]
MDSKWIKRLVGLVVLALLAAATVYALMPQPVSVDVAVIERGPIEVTIDEE